MTMFRVFEISGTHLVGQLPVLPTMILHLYGLMVMDLGLQSIGPPLNPQRRPMVTTWSISIQMMVTTKLNQVTSGLGITVWYRTLLFVKSIKTMLT